MLGQAHAATVLASVMHSQHSGLMRAGPHAALIPDNHSMLPKDTQSPACCGELHKARKTSMVNFLADRQLYAVNLGQQIGVLCN